MENKHLHSGLWRDDKTGKIALERCPKCGRENYIMNVLLGICTWCGFDRTGCVFCGFGAQFNSSRFRILYERYPKLYCMAMNYTNNGYTIRHALRRMGVMLPDEQRELF